MIVVGPVALKLKHSGRARHPYGARLNAAPHCGIVGDRGYGATRVLHDVDVVAFFQHLQLGPRDTDFREARESREGVGRSPAPAPLSGQGCLNPQELTDILHGQEPDKAAVLRDRKGVTIAVSEPSQGGFQHLAGIHDLEAAIHDSSHGSPPVPFRESFEEILLGYDALYSVVRHHGEVPLRASQDESDGTIKAVTRSKALKIGDHGSTHGNAAQGGPHLGHARLLGGADPDEKGDEEKEWVAEQANEPQEKGDPLTEVGGDLSGPGVVGAHGEKGPQHSPAVHGKGWNHVETSQEEIHHHHALHERAGGDGQVGQRLQAPRHDEGNEKEGGNDEVHCRSCQGHPELLDGLVGHALQSGHAADGEQGDVTGPDAVPLGGDGMA
jgi:hypothetical protein